MKKFIIFLMFLISGTSIYLSLNTSKASTENIEESTISPTNELSILNTPKEEEYNLTNLIELNTNLCIELRYASENNFTGKSIYPSCAKALLLKDTADKLMAANEELYHLGYRIKVLDAYRPHKYQYILRDVATKQNPATANFIADPDKGSHHNRGASVDITLTYLDGREVDMPTEFDFFGPEASIYYEGCTKEQKENRELLGNIMVKHGFRRISSEWWHFDDINYADYEILEVDFNELY